MGGYDQTLTESTIRDAWEASIEAGVVLFDTAEVYGGGESERIIGRLLAADPGARDRVVIASKFMPSPWKLERALRLALGGTALAAQRLGVDSIDLYQIHGPISLRSHDALAERARRRPGRGTGQGGRRLQLLGQGDPRHGRRAAQARTAAGQQPGRVLPAAHHAATCRAPRLLPGARRRPAGLLAHRAGSPDRQVLGGQPAAREPHASRPTPWRRWTPSWPSCAASGRPTAAAPRARSRWPGSSPRARCRSRVPRTGPRREQNAGALGWRMTDDEVARLDAAAPLRQAGDPPARSGNTADTGGTVFEVIAALFDAGLPPLRGSQLFSHPVRLRPGGDDRRGPGAVPVGRAAQQRAPPAPPVVGRQDRGLDRRALSTTGVAIFSFVGVYDGELFWDHMVQHLLLIMVAAPLFAIASPIELAWRATTRHGPPRRHRGPALAAWPSSSSTPPSPSCSTPC